MSGASWIGGTPMKFRSTTYFIANGNHGNGPTFTFTPDGWRAKLTVMIPNATSAVIAQARQDFLGYSELKALVAVFWVRRVLPHSLPLYLKTGGPQQGKPALWATSFELLDNYTLNGHEFSPADAAHVNGLPKWRWAKAVLGYSTYRFDLLEDTDPDVRGLPPHSAHPDEGRLNRFVVRTERPASRVVTCPQGAFSWVPGPNEGGTAPCAFGVPVSEGVTEVTWRWSDVPAVPRAAIRRLMGTVNATEFDGFPPQTLLMGSPDIVETVQSTGAPGYQIDLKATYVSKIAKTNTNGNVAGETPLGWNHYLKKVKTTGGQVFIDYRLLTGSGAANGTTPFRATEYRDLFRDFSP